VPPSVFADSKTAGAWTASYRPAFWQPGQRQRQRYLGRMLRHQAEAAAEELDLVSRHVEGPTPSPHMIRRAAELGVLSPGVAAAMLGQDLPADPAARPSIRSCYAAHPSTQAEARHSIAESARHARDLAAFLSWAGIEHQDQVTLDLVQRYLADLQARGQAWDTRRHRLLVLRRACAIGARVHGLPDPLYRLRLDARRGAEAERRIQVIPLPALRAALRRASLGDRERVAILLCGFHGLRPSELARARVGDLQAGVLSVAQAERKNAASRRDLPLAPTAVQVLRRLSQGRPAEAPLLPSRGGRPYTGNGLGQWAADWLPAAVGQKATVKTLRKSFATWAIQSGIEARHVEAYLGHRAHNLAAVTSAHYVQAALARELRPVAAAIQRAIRGR